MAKRERTETPAVPAAVLQPRTWGGNELGGCSVSPTPP